MFQQVQARLRQPVPPAMAASVSRHPTAPGTPASLEFRSEAAIYPLISSHETRLAKGGS
jgi:hypothetical protein